MERNFSDLGIDPIKGAEIMQLLNVSPFDLQEPAKFQRVRDIVDFLKKYEDYSFLINKITLGKNVDKVDHVWGYIELNKQKQQKLTELQRVAQQVDTFIDFTSKKDMGNPEDSDTYRQLIDTRFAKEKEVARIDEELSFYER